MEVNPDQGINVGSNPFYRPSNSAYGSQWQASKGDNPVKMNEIPQYPDVVSLLSQSLVYICVTFYWLVHNAKREFHRYVTV